MDALAGMLQDSHINLFEKRGAEQKLYAAKQKMREVLNTLISTSHTHRVLRRSRLTLHHSLSFAFFA